jgi:hypothetical protein
VTQVRIVAGGFDLNAPPGYLKAHYPLEDGAGRSVIEHTGQHGGGVLVGGAAWREFDAPRQSGWNVPSLVSPPPPPPPSPPPASPSPPPPPPPPRTLPARAHDMSIDAASAYKPIAELIDQLNR